jgi:hypothetical protein
MNDHKATLEHWAAVEAYAQEVSSTDDCLLELRARVEALERRCEVLQDRHHRLTLQVGHLEYELVRDDDDEPQQHCLEAMDPPEANTRAMTDPITPPPELVRHWSRFQGDTDPEALWFRIANEAAQWGADQELEACCEWADETGWQGAGDGLRTTRRPKPPSLAEQATAEHKGNPMVDYRSFN